MTNPFQIQFTLRQHTPMIHFQHHQDGATLRATEVKPKLDRFLIERMGGGNYDAGVEYAKSQKWLIGEGSNGNALDYKMRIMAQDAPKASEISHFPCFFADIGLKEDSSESVKKFILHAQPIKLQIICFHAELKTFIQKHFNDFIAQTNFGMRQSKGFGSFSVDGQTIDGAVARFTVNGNKQKNCESLFNCIDLFYKSLRGGVRTYGRDGSEFYFKSLLVTYYHQFTSPKPTLNWDKKAIKQVLEEYKTNINGTDIKDLLGFSTTEEWKKWRVSITKRDGRKDEIDVLEKNIKTETNRHEKDKPKEQKKALESALVDRFASPIVFKPIYNGENWTVFIFLQNIPQVYTDTTVLAKVRNETVSLKMWDSFDLKTFFKSIEKYKKGEVFEHHIETYYDPEKTKKSLDDFFEHFHCKSLKTLFSTYQTL